MKLKIINSDIRNVDFSKLEYDTIVWDQPFHYENLWGFIPNTNLGGRWLIVFSDAQRIGHAITGATSKKWEFVREFVTYQGGRFRGSDGVLNGHKVALLFKNVNADFLWTRPKYYEKELTSLTKVKKPNTKHKHYKDEEFIFAILSGINSGTVLDCFRGGGSVERGCALRGNDCTTIDYIED